GRRFAVRPANGDAAPVLQERRKHLAAMENRNATALCGNVLRIAPLDRRTHDDRRRTRYVGCIVPDRHTRAFAAQLFDQRRRVEIGTGDAFAARQQDARDRAHPDSPDADEVVAHVRFILAVSASTRAIIVATGSPALSRAAADWSCARRSGAAASASA